MGIRYSCYETCFRICSLLARRRTNRGSVSPLPASGPLTTPSTPIRSDADAEFHDKPCLVIRLVNKPIVSVCGFFSIYS